MTPDDISHDLAAPFDPAAVRFRAGAVQGNRAMALAYLDARAVQDRLDDVLGTAGWQDKYTCLPDGQVVCELSILFGDEWITKSDVGGQSEQPDSGDRMKAAFSDALKRAAVKFGIGRYLYRLPSQWVDYDPVKRQFARRPALPQWAMPGSPAPGDRYQRLIVLADQYGKLIHQPADRVLAELHRSCGVAAGRPFNDFTSEQWECLFTKLEGAIIKASSHTSKELTS